MQLQGIVFIRLQGNDILVNCQGNIGSFKEHILIHKKYNHSRQLYSDTKLYSFQGTLSVRSRKYILIQWKHIHSGKLYPFKELCSFKKHIFVQVQGHMFIQGNYIYWTLLHSRNSRNTYSKIVPSHFIRFMIIISFTITISWIKYSYNFFRLKDEEIADMIEFRNIITIRVVFATIVRRNTTRSASRFRHYKLLYLRQNLICPPANRLYLKKLLNILQTLSSCSRYTTFFLFESRFHQQNLPVPKRFPLFTH